ncbi:hypothetical protein [Mesorhizobium caraganae]|uniref:hypothetical protein n=1 Tax=Mesorhizobium caraganae TaxID=483206 RepID=UPI003ED04339
MPVKRRKAKGKTHKITDAAIEAYKARDFIALHRSLNLRPWEMSPLPDHPLGCDPERPPNHADANLFAQSFQQAVDLQRELEAACK